MNNRLAKFCIGVLLASNLLACGGFDATERSEPTLADLQQVAPPQKDDALPVVSRRKVIDSYRSLLEITDDPEIRARAMARLGDLMMLESEERQLDSGETQQAVNRRYYDEVVAYYRQLLAEYPEREGNDSLYYQLSKAYDLDARQEESAETLDRLVRKYPDSPYAAEAHFRSGELLFADQRYREAQHDYEQVLRFGLDTPFFDNALYMKGWCEFKRSRYEESLLSYWRVMNRIWPKNTAVEDLRKSHQNLVDDTLRVMSLAFSYLDGPVSIRQLTADAGKMHYEPVLYEQLAELYLSKKRYKDTADTYQTFIDVYPNSDQAPLFHVRQIDAYDKGNFPTLILPAKQQYVENYGINSYFWSIKEEAVRDSLKPKLREYLQELAKVAHADAQEMKQIWQKNLGNKRKLAKLKFTDEDYFEQYRQAGRWYKEYLMTFPDADNSNALWFLYAESQYEARDYADAIGTYQRIAYAIPDHPKGAEAGYAALLTYDQHIETLADQPAGVKERWDDKRVDSSLRFADTYPGDPRASAVLLKASEDLLARQRYADAVSNARRLIDWQPTINQRQRLDAWLVISHGEFEQQNYAAAEQGYLQVRSLLPGDDPRLAGITENLAASVYKQGEQSLADGNVRDAIDQFLRVARVAPTAAIAVNAEFDAATHMLTLEAWPEAITVLQRFRQKYPNHELSKEVPAKLILAYQENGQWFEAAEELDQMARNDADPKSARTATYLSAELYQKSGRADKAVALFERYVASYPQPIEQQLEAVFQLSELQLAANNTTEYEKWLNKTIQIDRDMGAQRSDRSRYLAAKSSLHFADQRRAQFESVKLTLPLKKSLKRKKTALQAALQSYEQLANYQVEEFTTRATFNIANIYAQLSSDLINSERPPNMNELELAQYEVLLEEQAYPFEEQAIEIHETNARRSWAGIYDDWVQRSFEALAGLMPGRYNKEEITEVAADAIH